MKKTYASFTQDNERFFANEQHSSEVKLPAGTYNVEVNRVTGRIEFTNFKITHDSLIDLPNKEFKDIVGQLEHFMKPETRAVYESFGFIYKHSILMHGLPGTGKTCIANRVVKHAVDRGAIGLFNPDPRLLPTALTQLEQIQPTTLTVVMFEEFEKFAGRFESELLSILDGQIQKTNVIYLATTNHLDMISARLKRPGRFASVIETFDPAAECRAFYLKHKLGTNRDVTKWVELTSGLSIDELKETVIEVECLNRKLEDVVTKIKATKKRAESSISYIPESDEKEILPMCYDKEIA